VGGYKQTDRNNLWKGKPKQSQDEDYNSQGYQAPANPSNLRALVPGSKMMQQRVSPNPPRYFEKPQAAANVRQGHSPNGQE